MTYADARKAWDTAGFLGDFNPASGQDAKIVETFTTSPFVTPGTSTSPLATATITTGISAPNCGSNRLLPKLIGLTVADARLRWDANGFVVTDFSPPAGATDDQVVTSQTANPAATWGACVPATTLVTVTFEPAEEPLCLIPDLIGTQSSQAQTKWAAAEFDTAVQYNGATPFKIGGQDIVQNTPAYCGTTVVTVSP